jgi:hypothetical protein
MKYHFDQTQDVLYIDITSTQSNYSHGKIKPKNFHHNQPYNNMLPFAIIKNKVCKVGRIIEYGK